MAPRKPGPACRRKEDRVLAEPGEPQAAEQAAHSVPEEGAAPAGPLRAQDDPAPTWKSSEGQREANPLPPE